MPRRRQTTHKVSYRKDAKEFVISVRLPGRLRYVTQQELIKSLKVKYQRELVSCHVEKDHILHLITKHNPESLKIIEDFAKSIQAKVTEALRAATLQ